MLVLLCSPNNMNRVFYLHSYYPSSGIFNAHLICAPLSSCAYISSLIKLIQIYICVSCVRTLRTIPFSIWVTQIEYFTYAECANRSESHKSRCFTYAECANRQNTYACHHRWIKISQEWAILIRCKIRKVDISYFSLYSLQSHFSYFEHNKKE